MPVAERLRMTPHSAVVCNEARGIWQGISIRGPHALMSETYFGGFDMDRFDFIGLHEQRLLDVPRLGDMLGVSLDLTVCENRTPYDPERDEFASSPAALARLADILRQDVAFYEAICAKR